MLGDSQSRGHSYGHRPNDDLSEIVVVGSNTPESQTIVVSSGGPTKESMISILTPNIEPSWTPGKTSAIPLGTLNPQSTVGIATADIQLSTKEDADTYPSNDNRGRHGNETKISAKHRLLSMFKTQGSPLREEIFEEHEGSEKRIIDGRNPLMRNPTLPQESGSEAAVNKTVAAPSTQGTPPSAIVKSVPAEKDRKRSRFRLMSKAVKSAVNDGNGGDNDDGREESEVDYEDEDCSGNESESEYEEESDCEDDESSSAVLEDTSLSVPCWPEITTNIGTDEHDNVINEKNKNDEDKEKGKGEDQDAHLVRDEKSEIDVKTRSTGLGFLKVIKKKIPFPHSANGSAAKAKANPVRNDFKQRWYLQEIGGGVIGDPQSERKLPVVVPRDKDWKCSLVRGDIQNGFYSIVFCMSYTCIGDKKDGLNSLTIDANLFDSSDRPVHMNKTCKTIAEEEELKQIKLRKKTRVRLHRQIELSKDGQYIKFSINVKAYYLLKFKLHYVELQRNTPDSKDLLLFGEGRPQEYISVEHHRINDNSNEKVVRKPIVGVHSYNISSTGTYATTLCFNENDSAVIEIWSLKRNNKDGIESGYDATPRCYTTPLARGLIKISGNHPERTDICLSISSHGDYVALHPTKSLEDGIACQILHSTEDTSGGGNSELKNLTEISLPPGLQGFYGYGTFHFISTENENGQERESERYISCDGRSLTIYSTAGEWKQIYLTSLSPERRLDSAMNAILGMRGQHFAWTGGKENVVVRQMETENPTFLPIECGAETRTSLSRDGSQAAVLTNGTIAIFNATTGQCTANFGNGLYHDGSYYDVVLENGFAMMKDPPKEPEKGELEVKTAKRKVMRTGDNAYDRDNACVREHDIHPDYGLRYPALVGEQLFTYSQGTVVNIIRMDSRMIGAPEPGKFKDITMTPTPMFTIDQFPNRTCISSLGDIFLSTTNSVIDGKRMTILTIEYCISNPHRHLHLHPHTSDRPENVAYETSGSSVCLTIPLGTSHIAYPTLFLEASSRLAIITGRYLQVWRLSRPTTSSDSIAILEDVWALQEEDEKNYKLSDICSRQVNDTDVDLANGSQFRMSLKPAKWRKRPKERPVYTEPEMDRVVTFPHSMKDTLSISLEDRVKQGIRGVVDMYIDKYPGCQKAVIRYLEFLVQPSDKNPVSCIVTLCKLWKLNEKETFVKIMKDLLPKDRITWAPETNARNKNKEQDPLAILLDLAKTQPSVIGVAKVIMDYGVSHATSSANLPLLQPIFISMRNLWKMFPDEAQGCLNRMAFIPVISRPYIIDNHIIVRSPSVRLKFWRPVQKLWELSKTKRPIMQLCVNTSNPDSSNEMFTLPVFVASFDALWYYDLDDDRGENSEILIRARTMAIAKTNGASMATKTKMPRWRTLLYMIRHKLRLRSKMYVTYYDFNLEIFENPAIAALVTYKWSTIGFPYWLFRFIFQCLYYTMIVIAAIMQVYFPYLPVLVGIFFAIIFMAVVFLWLELLQAFQGLDRYTKSTYNFLDLLAFGIPMVGSADQLWVIWKHNPQGNSRILSFSVLIVFLHGLFELRIHGSVCKYVTIIQQAIFEIKGFFVIFAAGIVAFTIGILHLLHACPLGGCGSTDNDKSGSFPKDILGALSATYFFMGGRYDPVSENFSSQDWAFHFMMAVFFFFTVILMLNVLIALINVAFGKGDDGWRLVWVESRLRYIEAAENMSYHIPGYRESHSWFPNEIYFTATQKEKNVYEKKHDLS